MVCCISFDYASCVCGSGGSVNALRDNLFTGVTVTSDRFVVGQRAVLTCSGDSGVVERIEWQREGQVVVEAISCSAATRAGPRPSIRH